MVLSTGSGDGSSGSWIGSGDVSSGEGGSLSVTAGVEPSLWEVQFHFWLDLPRQMMQLVAYLRYVQDTVQVRQVAVFASQHNAGTSGVSGILTFASGTSSAGSSGQIIVATGSASNSPGGDVKLLVGQGEGNGNAGGNINLLSGLSASSTGGAVSVTSGVGTARQVVDFDSKWYWWHCR